MTCFLCIRSHRAVDGFHSWFVSFAASFKKIFFKYFTILSKSVSMIRTMYNILCPICRYFSKFGCKDIGIRFPLNIQASSRCYCGIVFQHFHYNLLEGLKQKTGLIITSWKASKATVLLSLVVSLSINRCVVDEVKNYIVKP